MGRPKLHPDDRKRVTEACNACRVSKKRCSATVPCTHCLKRGIGDTCFLTHQPRRVRRVHNENERTDASRVEAATIHVGGSEVEDANNDEFAASAASTGTYTEQTPNANGPIRHNGRQTTPRSSPRRDSIFTHRQASSLGSQTSCTAPESHSRMLLNRRGDRVFIGDFASISFLQFLRETVSAKIGPSKFSHNDKSENMLETQSSAVEQEASRNEAPGLTFEDTALYFDTYCLATAGIVDILSDAESQELENPTTEEAQTGTPMNPVLKDLIIAIGAQCYSLTSAQGIADRLFQRAQTQAFSRMLEDPDINMVRMFLLMAFYMCGKCRRNTAFMYLGIAARAAVSIGLHSCDPCFEPGSVESHLRTRIWMSVCNVDIIMSSLLGRPPATGGLKLSLQNLRDEHRFVPSARIPSIAPAFEILVIINEIVDDIYTKKDKSISTAERHLQTLQRWSQDLPTNLLRTDDSIVEPFNCRDLIAKLHLSCIYYFAVTLITRPALVTSLTMAEPGTTTLAQLASACQDAAMYLSQACADAYTKGILLGNMCFIKAWIFAAGLILGFAMFEDQNRDADIDAAFRGATEVLSFISIQSPQAGHYFEILSLLSSAIDKLRQRRLPRRQNKYVGKIFSLGEPDGGTTQGNEAELGGTSGVGDGGESQMFLGFGGSGTPGLFNGVDADVALDWDILNLSRWDSFPFVE